MSSNSFTNRQMTMALMPGDVRDYLLENPDFLADNSDLLTFLMPPRKQHGDKVQDFQQYMLLKLQDHYNAIKEEHEDLMLLMQEHMQRQSRFNSVILSLMDIGSFAEFVEYISHDMALELDQEAAFIMIEAGNVFDQGDFGGLKLVSNGFVARWLGDREIELAEQTETEPELFGDKAEFVRSRALLRIDINKKFPPVLLVLGHRDPMYYSTGLAAEQVEHLGAVIERCFRKWLDVAP